MEKSIQFAVIVAATVARLSAGSVNVDFTGVGGQTDSYGNLIAPYYATVNGVNGGLTYTLQPQTVNGQIQDTIWNLFNPNSGDKNITPPKLSTYSWLYAAESNYTLINPNNFNILTKVGGTALTGQIQELIFAPEPASIGGLLPAASFFIAVPS